MLVIVALCVVINLWLLMYAFIQDDSVIGCLAMAAVGVATLYWIFEFAAFEALGSI